MDAVNRDRNMEAGDAHASPVAPMGRRMADAIRVLSLDAVHKARSGHQGMPLGMADVATVLWSKFLKFDPQKPDWFDRDRFVLSAGHGSMLLYSLLYLTGTAGISIDDLKAFRQLGSITPGHPEYGHTPGVDCTTGPLGQGLATAVGMALAERMLNARFGNALVNHRTWVIAGDGCLMEGVSHEAISLAAQYRLNKLVVFYDDNNVTIEGYARDVEKGDAVARFKAAGWAARAVDGHDHKAIDSAIRWALRQSKPVMIACRTTISRGAGPREGDPHSHGYAFFDDDIAQARNAMDWHLPPFEIPDDILTAWQVGGRSGTRIRTLWEKNVASSLWRDEFRTAVDGTIPPSAWASLDCLIADRLKNPVAEATRQSSGAALARLVPQIRTLVGGSADLTGSNNTLVDGMTYVSAGQYGGRYLQYGVREFGMACAMNGMAVHGGLIPYGGAFMVFSDYCRAAVRLAALMKARAIYVMTHDSIGVGEDGPTHQPVEHLTSFRAMPGVLLLRPADVVETAECWKAALQFQGPSVLALSRQGVPMARTEGGDLALKGAYELRAADGDALVSIFASGTEVSIALKARDILQEIGVATRVVSTPCWQLFDRQPDAYRQEVLGDTQINVAIEAASPLGWEKFIGRDGIFVGMTGFGASAPAGQLYEVFDITADEIVAQVRSRLGAGALFQI